YAVWEKNEYQIEYNANGGQGTELLEHVKEGDNITISDGQLFSYVDHHLLGWSTDPNATQIEYELGKQILFPIDKVQNDKLVLYAVWKENLKTYSIEYNANGGQGTENGHTGIHEGGQVKLSDGGNLSRDKYHLLGWSTDAAATTPEYQLGEEMTLHIDKVQNGVLTLYAVWEENTYTVKYDPNGGVSSTNPIYVVKEGEQITIDDGQNFSFEGHHLLGWSTSATSNTVEYELGKDVLFPIDKVQNGVLTLYAVWKENPTTYTIEYNANGGQGTESSHTGIQEGEHVKLSDGAKFTRDDFYLLGWSTDAAATTPEYQLGEEMTLHIDKVQSGVLTLYAIWEADPTDEDVPNVPPQEEEGEPNTPPQEEEGEPNTPPQEEEGEPNVPPQKEDTPNIPSEKEDVTNTTNPTAEKTENTSQPVQTGDKWNGFFLVSFLISGGVLGVVIYKRRRA
ncbi:MAG: InlB B-repeat-containing protein, partial [Candidatus Ruminococcus intestinipullorum]|nr:InlB B-repeat-containing protein [Candidatus Ruminococcus intestinipullorum]